MNNIIGELIKKKNPQTLDETKAILREVVQEVVLVGLSRGNFFKKASFYGGTALRVFYGLNRYSEDLDFSLNQVDSSFTLLPYFGIIKEVASSYGLNLDIKIQEKRISTPVNSAFAKLNTYQAFVNLELNDEFSKLLHKDEVLKIKFEIDTSPALGFNTETRFLYQPEYAHIIVLDEPSLFAGKLHAILCRNYKNHVKGRDYYDYLFYLSHNISPNLTYLKNKLIASNVLGPNDSLDIKKLKELLLKRFATINFEEVKNDVRRFLFKNENLDYFTKELFIDSIKKLK